MVDHYNTHDGENIILMEVSMGNVICWFLKFLVPCLQMGIVCYYWKYTIIHLGTFEKIVDNVIHSWPHQNSFCL